MLTKFAKLTAVAALLLSAVAVAPASADTIWTLSNITFADGGTASGQFSYNSASATYAVLGNWNVTTTTGTSTVLGHTYAKPDINAFINPAQTIVDLYRPGYAGYLQLAFTTSLKDYSTLVLDVSNSFECDTYACGGPATNKRLIVASADGPAGATVPEPASLTLMGFGLLVVGFLFARRRKQAAAAI